MALLESQAMLHCADKAQLYNVEMLMGNRIKKARERLVPKPTQRDIGEAFDVTDKAVSAWERNDTVPELEKMPKLARILKVPLRWLLEGTGEPPAPDSLETLIDDLTAPQRAAVIAMVESFHSQRSRNPIHIQQGRRASKA